MCSKHKSLKGLHHNNGRSTTIKKSKLYYQHNTAISNFSVGLTKINKNICLPKIRIQILHICLTPHIQCKSQCCGYNCNIKLTVSNIYGEKKLYAHFGKLIFLLLFVCLALKFVCVVL